MENVLEVKNIEKYYGNKSNLTKAIDNISFNVKNGEFVGIMRKLDIIATMPKSQYYQRVASTQAEGLYV